MRVNEAARLLNVSASSVRNYCNTGRLAYSLNPGGQRTITQESIDKFLGKTTEQIMVCYVRSSSGDKALMNAQLSELESKYGTPTRFYKDRSSGLNDNRPGLWKMIKDAEAGKFNVLCITHQDRLTRFNYRYLQHILEKQNVVIKVLHETKKISLEEELMSDFMSIISVFAGKFYRLRSNENKKLLLEKAQRKISA